MATVEDDHAVNFEFELVRTFPRTHGVTHTSILTVFFFKVYIHY